jgi:hypothetical protein
MVAMTLVSLLGLGLLLGFAYIVLVSANKEGGALKITGQVLAVIIALLAITVFIYGASAGNKMKHRMGGMSCPMMGGMMQGNMMKGKKMDKMMQGKGGSKMMPDAGKCMPKK